MTAIQLHRVVKRFGRKAAVDVADLLVEAGESVAVQGPSGSGKTTLLRLMAGLESPDQGRILRAGKVAFAFQAPALWPHMTVADNIGFGIGSDMRRVSELLERVGLTGYEERYPDELSGGEAARVGLARALAPRAEILLCDEPLAHLDGEMRDQTLRLIAEEVRLSRATLVYVTHEAAEAARISSRIVRLCEGRLL